MLEEDLTRIQRELSRLQQRIYDRTISREEGGAELRRLQDELEGLRLKVPPPSPLSWEDQIKAEMALLRAERGHLVPTADDKSTKPRTLPTLDQARAMGFPGLRRKIDEALDSHDTQLADLDELARLVEILGDLATPGDQVHKVVLERLRYMLQNFLPRGSRLSWQLLPPGPSDLGTVVRTFEARAQAAGAEYDISRVTWLYKELASPLVFVGTDDFDGYVALCPRGFDLAVLDNPVVGNAIYILGRHWRELSRLSKGDLRRADDDRIKRIIHRGSWRTRFRGAFAELKVAVAR